MRDWTGTLELLSWNEMVPDQGAAPPPIKRWPPIATAIRWDLEKISPKLGSAIF